MNTDKYLMRSLMFVPAHNTHLMDSATRLDVDVLLLDLEDSVLPVENKQVARDNIIKYVKGNRFNNALVFPRVNDRESGELLKDIYQLTIEGISGFTYPKTTKGEDLYFFGKLLETIEYEKGISIGTYKIIPLIETTGAVMNIQEICSACPNRVVAVAFGCEDFVADLQGQHDIEGSSIFTARAMIAMGARANKVIPIDTVHIRVHDLDDLERNIKVAKRLGFEGMLALNPKELPLIHSYFSPSKEEIDDANEMIFLAKEAAKQGKGVAVKGDKFIGPPMVVAAKKLLKKAELLGKKYE